jgi:hypothetical protein
MPVSVINMIPNSMSFEVQRDSEPNVSVNPANRLHIVASAFTPDPLNSGNAPIFVSTDGGNTWVLNVVLPGGNRTGDTSLRFGGTSNVLYAGILRNDNGNLNILRTANFTLPGLMTILVNRANDDQPFVEAATVMGGAGTGLDRVYIGNNDLSVQTTTGHTATIDQSLDAATAPAPAGFGPIRIETRATALTPGGNQDGPSIRAAIHPQGRIYGVYFGWRVFGSPTNTTDIVVVRDDAWGSGPNPFTALIDPGNTLAGLRIETGVSVPALSTLLGTQRIGSQLAIAVDPTDSPRVYIAWADGNNAANYTIRVQRSTDRGETWSRDVRAIIQATNPGLAINSQGNVGFLYQQLVNPGTGNRWQTHLELSADGFASAPTDLILANEPDEKGSYPGPNPIGDYANLIAVGKDFYGVFSAYNTPDNMNFPNGVTYQRNANFATNTLLANDNVTTVNPSIDPFFFKYTEVGTSDDFYVRDWTDSPASGDTGLEPSTHPVFYTTSDVWNRRGTLPGPFANDQPSNEDAGNGVGNIGDNWAFARIRRNAPAAAGSTTVTAHFLVSKLGTGSNYADAGSMDPDVSFPAPDPTMTFAAADIGPITTPAYSWHLNPVSSTHLCLAVEISTPGDPFVPPSLVGNAPGWPTTDLRVINDNNKAQRNMGLSTTPARGVGLSDTFYAIVHNAATFRRDMRVRFYTTPEVLRRLGDVRVAIVSGRGRAGKPGSAITLSDMQPGENRWVALTFTPPQGDEGEVLPVYFSKLVGDTVVNGFAIAARLASMSQVIHDNLELHRSIFTRMLAGFAIPAAEKEVAVALDLLGRKEVAEREYREVLSSHLGTIAGAARELIGPHAVRDPFGVRRAIGVLHDSIASEEVERPAVAHTTLLNKLDAFLTMLQLLRGDTADILQNVRWQKDLYTRVSSLAQLECAKALRDRSEEFIAAYGERKIGNQEFPELLRGLLECFRATSKALADQKLDLERGIGAIERSQDNLIALQKAHQDFLLELQKLEG